MPARPPVVIVGVDIGIRNFSFCVLREDGKTLRVLEWRNVDLRASCPGLSGLSCKKLTPADLHDVAQCGLFRDLLSEDFVRRHRVQHVAIEQQPQGKYGNMRMILLSHLLLGHFLRMLRRLAPEEGFPLKTAALVSASTKYPKWLLDRHGWAKQKNYEKRKRLGVSTARLLCRNHNIEWNQEAKKKEDDYADSFLLAYFRMGVWMPQSVTSSSRFGEPSPSSPPRPAAA